MADARSGTGFSWTLAGGDLSRWTAAIRWYPTRQWRLEFNYGRGLLDRDDKGRFNVFQDESSGLCSIATLNKPLIPHS
jgi:hypothetical protein